MSEYKPNFIYIADKAEELRDTVEHITGETISIDTAVQCIVTLENTRKLDEIGNEIYCCCT